MFRSSDKVSQLRNIGKGTETHVLLEKNDDFGVRWLGLGRNAKNLKYEKRRHDTEVRRMKIECQKFLFPLGCG